MKYLVSAIELGKLIATNNIHERENMVNEIISLKYVCKTDDKDNLTDVIRINTMIEGQRMEIRKILNRK